MIALIYTLKEVAGMIGENLETIEEVTEKIAEGELVYVRDGSEDGTRASPITAWTISENLSPTYEYGMIASASSSSVSNASQR